VACDVLDANRGDCRRGPDDCGGCCLPSSLLSSSSVFAVFVGVQEVLLSDVDASLQRLATAAAAAATAAAAAAAPVITSLISSTFDLLDALKSLLFEIFLLTCFFFFASSFFFRASCFFLSRSCVHTPLGPRKSGIPAPVDMPAPVMMTTFLASTRSFASFLILMLVTR